MSATTAPANAICQGHVRTTASGNTGFDRCAAGYQGREAAAIHTVNGINLCGFHSPYDAEAEVQADESAPDATWERQVGLEMENLVVDGTAVGYIVNAGRRWQGHRFTYGHGRNPMVTWATDKAKVQDKLVALLVK